MRSLFFTLSLLSLGFFASINTVRAQVSSDGSLSTTVSSPDGSNFTIDNGNRAGGNLFHSFSQFSVPTGGSAVFQNPVDVQNIISRVTGGSISNIDGLIRANGSANLFLINPAGIAFGPNASLSIGGSFFATTANSLLFGDGVEFSATNLQTPPVLTVNIPIGLRFRDNPGSITNQSIFRNANNNLVGLQVQPGNSLALVGGNINISNGGRLTATGGSIELGGLAAEGTVGLDVTGNSFKLNFPSNSLLSDITISNARVQNVVFSGTTGTAGDVSITTNNLSLINGGIIDASTYGTGNAGRVVINATGNISISGKDKQGSDSAILSRVSQQAEGNSGGIQINTNNLSLTDGGFSSASTFGKGNAGRVIIHATGNVSAKEIGSGIYSAVGPQGEGNSDGIEITTNNLSLTNGAIINAGTFGKGNAGRVVINATGNISASGEAQNGNNSGIFSIVSEQAEGDAGGIQINTKDLSLTNGGQIDASTGGKGNAGSVIINAIGNISASGESKDGYKSGIFSIVSEQAEGDAGGIQINTNNLSLTNGAIINVGTFGKGNAGRVVINATGNISASSSTSGIFSIVQSGVGNAGGIQITTNNLFLNDSGRISASTGGKGNAGRVIINATGNISASGESKDGYKSGIFSAVAPQGEGNSDGIEITTNNLSLTNGGVINASTGGNGKAGSVIINATGDIFVSSESKDSGIFSNVDSSGVGNAGGIKINARSLSLSNGATLKTDSLGTGTAGNIEVTTAKDIRLDNQASITANTTGGEGNIFLNSRDLILRRNSNITTDATGTATGGSITIKTDNLVAFPKEDSNISASADEGPGGRVSIRATRIFGIEFREKPTKKSDITVTSNLGPDFSGTVQINSLDVDPSQGLVQLPNNLADVSNQIAQNPCQKGAGSSFTVNGRGGFPSSPDDGFRSNETRIDLVEPVASSSSSQNSTINQPTTQPTAKQIIPAQGWIFNDKGEVVLTAYDPTNISTAQRSSKATTTCTAPF